MDLTDSLPFASGQEFVPWLTEPPGGKGAQDINMGTKFMWTDFDPKTEDQGVATHVYTAFSPDLEGKSSTILIRDCRYALEAKAY